MPSINPADSSLRRIHHVDAEKVATFKALLARNHGFPEITLYRYCIVSPFEYWIVLDGTHRTQAALEHGLASIEYRVETMSFRLRQELQDNNLNLDDLAQHAKRFTPGVYY